MCEGGLHVCRPTEQAFQIECCGQHPTGETHAMHTLSVKRMRPWPSGRRLPPGERGEVPLAAVGLAGSSLERPRTGDTAS